MFTSLLAASVDGFVCGLTAAGMGIKFGSKDLIKSFIIIYLCCFTAATVGNLLSRSKISLYLNIIGGILFLCLALDGVKGAKHSPKINSKVYMIAFSVAADASIISVYLGLEGYNCFAVAFLSSALHCILMALAFKIYSVKTVKKPAVLYWGACCVFLLMALDKFIQAAKSV